MSGTRVEPALSAEAQDLHRALNSLQEELEAVDYYNQRADQTQDEELRDLLLHNRDEEAEHAAMLTEWIRRRTPSFDRELRDYLFTDKPVTQIEEGGAGADASSPPEAGLAIGSLKSR